MATKLKLDHHMVPYAPMFAQWQKRWGTKPTSEALQTAHHMVSTRGGKHAVFAALAMRPEGVHDWQCYEATQTFDYVGGAPQYLHVYRNRVCDAGMFERDTNKMPVSADKPFGADNTHTKMRLTDKGKTELKKHLASGAIEASFKRMAVARLAAFEAVEAAKRQAAAEKAKATRESKKAAKLAAHEAAPFENTVTMPHTIDEAMAVKVDTNN